MRYEMSRKASNFNEFVLSPVACPCEHDNESSDSMTGEVFLDQLSDYRFLTEESAPWNYCISIGIIKGIITVAHLYM
jgi:hypothetical protein